LAEIVPLCPSMTVASPMDALGNGLRMIETLLEPAFAAARSLTPSPLKSFAVMRKAPVVPVLNCVGALNWPVLSPSSTVMLLVLLPPTARSSLPSLLKSPSASVKGPPNALKLVAVPKPPVPSPRNIEMVPPPRLAAAKSCFPHH